MPRTLAAFAAALIAMAPTARAEAPPAAVTVSVGRSLEIKRGDYGARELDYLRDELAQAVAARAAKGGFTRLDLVLEDALPNRPTFEMQSRLPQLSLTSIALGGAKVSGTAYGPAGERPLRFSLWSNDLRDVIGSSTWTDAERAFDSLGGRLSRGEVPDRFARDAPQSRPTSRAGSAWRQ